MRAFVQEEMQGELNIALATIGLESVGRDVQSRSGIGYPMMPGEIAYGNVNWIKQTMEACGIRRPVFGYIPEVLQRGAIGLTRMTVNNARRSGLFIKPIPERQKAFNGFVDKNPAQTMLNLASYHDDVMVANVFNFVSEWRVFVHKGEAIAAEHYKGDFRISPNWKCVDSAANAQWENKPIAWSCDFGVTSEGETLLIEMHEVFSLGTYGVNPTLFAIMLEDAWDEVWLKHQSK